MNTKQKLFNISLQHIRKQGKPSISGEDGYCMYKDPKGLSCAAAPFILEYDSEMESNTFDQVATHNPEAVLPEAREEMLFVTRLQKCHDDAAGGFFMHEYETRMQQLAKEYDLEYQAETV